MIDKFDFSLISYNTLDNIHIIEGNKPYNVEEEIFQLLGQSTTDKGEFRFSGIIDDNMYLFYNVYVKNNYVWENIFYDEFANLLDNVVHLKHFNRIQNCLDY